MADETGDNPEFDAEFFKRRKQRNWAILAGLVAWIVVIYIVAILRMSGAGG